MNTVAAPAARTVGREQSCDQCGATYRARRSTSRYCTPACRQRAHHGSPGSSPEKANTVHGWLLRRGFAGKIGPVNRRDPRPAIYGLTVPRSHALAEFNHEHRAPIMRPGEYRLSLRDALAREPRQAMTDTELVAVLKALGILDFHDAPKLRQAKR
jgi:hypothetical protein